MNTGRDFRLNYILTFLCVFCLMQTATSHAQWSTNGNDIYNNNSGNVGIGTTNPLQPLDVRTPNSSGDVQLRLGLVGGNVFDIGRRVSDGFLSIQGTQTGNNSILLAPTSGNVGIGTASPGSKLDVAGQVYIANAGGDSLHIGNNQFIKMANTSGAQKLLLGISNNDETYLRGATGLHLQSNDGGQEVTILNNGSVGIGTTNPQAKLQVAGDIVVDGNISAKYQDLAEWVPSNKAIQSGYVVIVDQTLPGNVLPSTEAYDTRVAGVVSASPGIVLGESGRGKVKVATVGRVKVKVDATRNPIKIGDLLVTSGNAGMAMKSEPVDISGIKIHRPGTLLGKALEPLKDGVGEILVLLSLQ